MINPTGLPLSLTATTLTTAQLNAEPDAITEIDAAVTVTESAAVEKSPSDTPSDRLGKADPYQSEWEKSTLDKALETLNQDMQAWSTGLRFDIDPDTQRIVLSIVDNDSGEVIRTVPSEAVMTVAKMIAQFQGKGISVKA